MVFAIFSVHSLAFKPEVSKTSAVVHYLNDKTNISCILPLWGLDRLEKLKLKLHSVLVQTTCIDWKLAFCFIFHATGHGDVICLCKCCISREMQFTARRFIVFGQFCAMHRQLQRQIFSFHSVTYQCALFLQFVVSWWNILTLVSKETHFESVSDKSYLLLQLFVFLDLLKTYVEICNTSSSTN